MLDFKRIFILFIIIILIVFSIFICYKKIVNNKSEKISEIIPQEEITDDQMRSTTISLYLKKDGKLVKEQKNIDSKILLNEPYKEILNILIKESENSSEKTLPKGAILKNIKKEGDTLLIDFSKEFINNIEGENEQKIAINSIIKTMTQLTEINEIKISVEGEEIKI